MFMLKEDVNPLKEDGSPKSPEEIEKEVALGNAAPTPGSKTPPELLLKSLQEERTKRQELEARIELLENSSANPDLLSEEGKVLKGEIDELRSELSKKDVQIAHPVLKDKWAEFEKFRSDPENKGMNLKTAAKAFLVENGLLDTPRKGLERPTGGDRVVPSTKMTHEEVKRLRETDFKKYTMLLEKGLIEV